MKSGALLVVTLCLSALPLAAEPLPPALSGTWRVTRVIKSATTPCWDAAQARSQVGSTLSYNAKSMRWRGESVPIDDILTRSVSANQFASENTIFGTPPNFTQLGITAKRVTEVDIQHEDADITGATTEVPGDAVLLIAPNKIIISACGVFFEASKSASQAH